MKKKATLKRQLHDKYCVGYLQSITDSMKSASLSPAWDDSVNAADVKHNELSSEDEVTCLHVVKPQYDGLSVGLGPFLMSNENVYGKSLVDIVRSFWYNGSLMDIEERKWLYWLLLSLVETLASHKETLMTLFVEPVKGMLSLSQIFVFISNSIKEESESSGESDSEDEIRIVNSAGDNAKLAQASVVLSNATRRSYSLYYLLKEFSRSQCATYLKTQSPSKIEEYKNSYPSGNLPSNFLCQECPKVDGIIIATGTFSGEEFLIRFSLRLQNLCNRLGDSSCGLSGGLSLVSYRLSMLPETLRTDENFQAGHVTKGQRRKLLAANLELTPEEKKKAYVVAMNDIKFKSFAILDFISAGLTDHYYMREALLIGASLSAHPRRLSRISKELSTLATSLPVAWGSSIVVRADHDRADLLKVLIFGKILATANCLS